MHRQWTTFETYASELFKQAREINTATFPLMKSPSDPKTGGFINFLLCEPLKVKNVYGSQTISPGTPIFWLKKFQRVQYFNKVNVITS